MQIVIDIPEYLYKAIQSYKNPKEEEKAIANGTPLPKGHGRLIDADELKDMFKYTEDADNCKWTSHGVIWEIDNADTILEATEVEE